MIRRFTARLGGPGSGPQGPRQAYVPHPRGASNVQPAAPAKADRIKPSYSEHGSGNVKVSPNGQIKLTTPKTVAEASEMLDSMNKITDGALKDVEAAMHLPLDSYEKVAADLRLVHVAKQSQLATKMAQNVLSVATSAKAEPQGEHDASKSRDFKAMPGIGNSKEFIKAVEAAGGKTVKDGKNIMVVPPKSGGDKFWSQVEKARVDHAISGNDGGPNLTEESIKASHEDVVAKDAANQDAIKDRSSEPIEDLNLDTKSQGQIESGKWPDQFGEAKSFDSPKAADKWADQQYGKYTSGLSDQAKKAIGDYTTVTAFRINNSLREGKLPKESKLPGGLADVKELDSAIENAPPLKEEVGTYRGVAFQYDGVKAGDVLIDEGFMSTSLNKDVAHSFGSTEDAKEAGTKGAARLYITVPEGGKAMYVGGIGNIKSEQELILPRQTTMRIRDIRYDSEGVQHIHAEVCYDC